MDQLTERVTGGSPGVDFADEDLTTTYRRLDWRAHRGGPRVGSPAVDVGSRAVPRTEGLSPVPHQIDQSTRVQLRRDGQVLNEAMTSSSRQSAFQER